MQCRTCGAPLTPGAATCMRCGTPVAAPAYAADRTVFDPSSQRPPYPPAYQGGPSPSSFGPPQGQNGPAYPQPSPGQGGFNGPQGQGASPYPSHVRQQQQVGGTSFVGATPFSTRSVPNPASLPPQSSFANGFQQQSPNNPNYGGNGPFGGPQQGPNNPNNPNYGGNGPFGGPQQGPNNPNNPNYGGNGPFGGSQQNLNNPNNPNNPNYSGNGPFGGPQGPNNPNVFPGGQGPQPGANVATFPSSQSWQGQNQGSGQGGPMGSAASWQGQNGQGGPMGSAAGWQGQNGQGGPMGSAAGWQNQGHGNPAMGAPASWTGPLTGKQKKSKRGLIITLVLLVVVLIGAFGAYYKIPAVHNLAHGAISQNSVPSGNSIDSQTSAIIKDAQTATGVDKSTYLPSSAQVTSTFKVKQSIYVSLSLDTKQYDVSKQPAYLLVVFYAGSTNVIKNEKPLTIDRSISAAYFVAQYYIATDSGAAEVYWCKQSSCSDRKLATVLHFTVS